MAGGSMRLHATVIFLPLIVGVATAQPADSKLTFEVATIKPFAPGAVIRMSGCQGGPGGGDPSRINCEYVTLKMLLMRAYDRKASEIFGPDWLDTEHFNVTATVPAGTTRDKMPLMFQSLLA